MRSGNRRIVVKGYKSKKTIKKTKKGFLVLWNLLYQESHLPTALILKFTTYLNYLI